MQAASTLARSRCSVGGPRLPRHSRRAVVRAAGRTVSEELQKMEEDRVKLRSEAEAPFRALRLVFYGFSVVSASIATLISVPQLVGALGGAPGALTTQTVGVNLAVNLGAITVFGLLFRSDWQAREKQMARLEREEKLAALQLTLASGRGARVRDLQGASRVVVVAGTPAQVAAAVAAAEPFRDALLKRGVFVVTAPIFDGSAVPAADGAAAAELAPPTRADLRWRATATRLDAWRGWFEAQLQLSTKTTPEAGLYIGLRLDGRVRASGKGCPPWARFAAELAPMDGNAFMDGFDGDSGVK